MLDNDGACEAGKNPNQLSGGKDIALSLDKAVRTGQRWEPELGLPVHRRLGRSGLIDHPFKRAEEGQLSPVGRFDGRRWAPSPAPEIPTR
jgi:hypothetical protein